MKEELMTKLGQALSSVRCKKPLIHHITNYVTVNDCANVVLAIGASPVMADDINEAADITGIASALVLNIGTLNSRTVMSMLAAGKKANECSIPVIFDPVGVGASIFRNQTTQLLLKEVKISVLRGNMSEISVVAGLETTTKGVDASDNDLEKGVEAGRKIAEKVAKQLCCVVAITGVTDIISDGKRTIVIENGTKWLSNVTGTGCMCTSLVGAFCGVVDDLLIATVGGILTMGIAGELAQDDTKTKGNGSFHVAIIDEISKMNAQIFEERAKIYEA